MAVPMVFPFACKNEKRGQKGGTSLTILRASAKINHPVLLVFSAIFFVTERVS
jgi:hypothetical protein